MDKKPNFFQRFFGRSQKSEPEKERELVKKPIDDRPDISAVPGGRVSQPHTSSSDSIMPRLSSNGVVTAPFLLEIIPIIRQLCIWNPDVSQALHNVVTLANTGHKVFFDRKVPPEQVDKMRNHLENKRKTWSTGTAGANGIVNKMIAQLMIGGAISNEWVVNNELTGIQGVSFVNPEDIVFKLSKDRTRYDSYQRTKNTGLKTVNDQGLIKLNPNTFRYFGHGGDTEIPYGIPPYIPVIKKAKIQNDMEDNISFIIDQLGLIGFLEVLMDKPSNMSTGDSDSDYQKRLDSLLDQAKSRVMQGLKDGVVAGYKDDHEFKFNSFSKSYDHALSLYESNELQVASAVKQDAQLWGRAYSSSETQITVVFTKMLSEFKNLHNILKENLEFGYALELRLAGFQFDFLKVKFNPSTIQDELKFQQSEEIKVRNVKDKLLLGIINQDQAADELGYEAPAYPEPRVTFDQLAGGKALETDNTKDAKDRKADKKKSESETRKKNKPLPK